MRSNIFRNRAQYFCIKWIVVAVFVVSHDIVRALYNCRHLRQPHYAWARILATDKHYDRLHRNLFELFLYGIDRTWSTKWRTNLMGVESKTILNIFICVLWHSEKSEIIFSKSSGIIICVFKLLLILLFN